jgi:erythromycin esterase
MLLAVLALTTLDACHSAKPAAPPPAPVPLTDSAASALAWISQNAVPFTPTDSGPATGAERALLDRLVAGARVIGFSELVEGTSEFPYILRRALPALADSGVRGIALQASMVDAMAVDRYVREGVGDPGRLLRVLNPAESQRIATRQTQALVEALRAWNRANPSRQIGFYGFEIPTAAVAVKNRFMGAHATAPARGAWCPFGSRDAVGFRASGSVPTCGHRCPRGRKAGFPASASVPTLPALLNARAVA